MSQPRPPKLQSAGIGTCSSIFPPTYKVVIIGKYGVGKTTLLWRYIYRDFCKHIGNKITLLDKITKSVKVDDGKEIQMEFWDTAGAEKFRSISPNYFHDVCAVIVVYDITDPDSFAELKDSWIQAIFSYFGEDADERIPIVIVGNKCDLVDKCDCSQVLVNKKDVNTELKGKHEKLLGPIECSAKSGKNVERIFEDLAKQLVTRERIRPGPLPKRGMTPSDNPCCNKL